MHLTKPKRTARFFNLLLAGVVLCGIPNATRAQEQQWSTGPYYPWSLNPALCGQFSGIWRAAATYRVHTLASGNALNALQLGADGRLPVLEDKIGVGALLYNDDAGPGRINSTKVYAAACYRHSWGENLLMAGIRGGYVSSTLGSWNNWNRTTASYSVPNGETSLNQSVGYLDLHAGVTWIRKIGRFVPLAGWTLMHLNQPTLTFTQGDNRLSMEQVLQLQSDIDIHPHLTMIPVILLSGTEGVRPTMLGAQARYTFAGSTSWFSNFTGGVLLRNGIADKLSALSFQAGTRIRTFDLLLAYDLPMGDFEATSGSQGAFEITLIYRQLPIVLNSYSIPCERF